MNGFEKHAITYSSPSSINLFAAAPDVWVAEKLFGMRGKTSVSAWRGIVIEDAILNIIAHGLSEEEAVNHAIARFNKENSLNNSPKIDDEREAIAPCVKLAIAELKQYGQPVFKQAGKQDKIELLCKGDGWELPIIGYTDLPFPKHGLIVDIKTTLKIPSVMSSAHNRQCAIYRHASGNSAVRFLYVSPKKIAWHECTDVAGTLGEVKTILNRQEKFLRIGDKDVLRGLVHFDPDSFYWNGNEQSRSEIYGQ